MPVTVRFLSVFPEFRGPKKVVKVNPASLCEIIDQLENRMPGLKTKLIAREGKIHPAYIIVLKRGEIQKLCKDVNHIVKEGDEVIILPVISGG